MALTEGVDQLSDKIPVSMFSTDQSNPVDRFEAWRESISIIFDVEAKEKPVSSAFTAAVRTYHLDKILVGVTRFGAQHFSRNRQKISRDGIDHYFIQLYDKGALVGSTNAGKMSVRPGDIQIVDLGRPHESVVQNSSTIAIAVPRDILSEFFPARSDLHGLVLQGDRGAGGLLADYMRSLSLRLESVVAAEVPFVTRATLQMLCACLYPAADSKTRARAEIETVIVERLKRYLRENLQVRDLNPALVCRKFNISRSQLYRMFESLGGVMNYIQTQRLEMAFKQLSDPLLRHRQIYEIGYDLGFTSMAHFSRVFRFQFGVSPSEVRATPALPHRMNEPKVEIKRVTKRGYEEWLRDLGRRTRTPSAC